MVFLGGLHVMTTGKEVKNSEFERKIEKSSISNVDVRDGGDNRQTGDGDHGNADSRRDSQESF